MTVSSHVKCETGMSLDIGGMVATVGGKYEFYHYGQEGIADIGWGCAYRSCQTICSWLLLNGYVDQPVPSIEQMQQVHFSIEERL